MLKKYSLRQNITTILALIQFCTLSAQNNMEIPKSGKLESNGIQLYYEITGKGPFLILIEGLGAATYLWDNQAPEFSKYFTTVVFDNRGVGKSDKPAGPYTISMMSDDLAGLMEALEIRKAHILGVSMGGFIAQDFAIRYPEKVNKLILCCTSSGGKEHVPMSSEVLSLVLKNDGDPLELLKEKLTLAYTERYLHDSNNVNYLLKLRLENPQPPSAYQAQAMAGIGFDQTANVTKITSKTLILAADEDILVPIQNAWNLKNKIPNSTLKIYNHLGHQFFVEDYKKFNADVVNFLQNY